MRGNQYEKILLIEDKNNLIEHTLKILIEKGNGNICIASDSEDALEREPNGVLSTETPYTSGTGFALIYTKPPLGKEADSDLLEINPDLNVMPLLLLVGPTKEMDNIKRGLHEDYRCFNEPVNLPEFIGKMEGIPMFWASINTTSVNDMN